MVASPPSAQAVGSPLGEGLASPPPMMPACEPAKKTKRRLKRAIATVGALRGVGLTRCPVESASVVARYSRPASTSQPIIASAVMRVPSSANSSPTATPKSITAEPALTKSGRSEGGGRCTPSGGPLGAAAAGASSTCSAIAEPAPSASYSRTASRPHATSDKTKRTPATASAGPPSATEKKSAPDAAEMRNGARLGPGR